MMQQMNMAQMMIEFIKFRNNFQGDPKAEVEKMLASGKISQQQLNEAQQMAVQFQNMLQQMK